MAYIGRDTDKISNVEVLDNITFDGSSSYTLQKGGSNFTPSSANTLLVSINGVVQAGNFTVSGSTIDFGTAVAGTSTCDFILHYGIGLITSVSDGTVTTAKLGDNAVTNVKVNDDLISGATALTSEPADTDEFLVSDAGTLKRIDYSLIKGGGITEIDTWRVTADFSGGGYVTANWERDDTYGNVLIGTGMSESSGVFTFPSTGVYQINFGSRFTRDTATPFTVGEIQVTTDNSSYNTAANSIGNVPVANYYDGFYIPYIFDVTSTSTHKVKFYMETNGLAVSFGGNTDRNFTYANFIRLGDT